MYTHVIFDVDGTIMDTSLVCEKALQRLVLSRTGRVLEPHECSFAFGMTGENALPTFGLQNTPDVVAEWDGYFNEMIGEARVFEGITELLTKLKVRGIKLGVLTSRAYSEINIDENFKNILHYFDNIIAADDTSEHKPSPAPMYEYLRRTGALPNEVLYIGDTIYDYECAKSAGVAFALATWGAGNTEGINTRLMPQAPNEILKFL